MILQLINRIVRNRIKYISFPKLPTKEYNKLWRVSLKKFIKLPLMEFLPIIRCLTLKFGASSLLAIPTIFWIIKKSDILNEKDSKDQYKMFKALDVDNNNIESFFKFSLLISLIIKFFIFIIWLLWLPLKIAIIFDILDYFNYDISFIYHKRNNLSLGILDLYYRTLIDFLESLIIKYDFYKLDHEHITKI